MTTEETTLGQKDKDREESRSKIVDEYLVDHEPSRR